MLIILALHIYSQSVEAEKQSINSRLMTGKISGDQASQLLKKWNAFIAKHSYPEIKIDTNTMSPDFSEILTFPNSDKKITYQRCLQWMAINFFVLTYSDFESGKIIGNGYFNLTHSEEIPVGFTNKEIRQIQTSVNYTLVLTLKDNKVRYNIQDISYSFTGFSDTIDEITYTINSIFPINTFEQRQWLKFITLLKGTNNKFSIVLKNSLVTYVNDAANDLNF